MNFEGWSISTTEIMRTIKTKPFFIFGAGEIAKRFFYELQKREMLSMFCGFIVSKKEVEFLYGERIYELDNINNNDSLEILIAVHDSILDDVFKKLEKFNKIKSYWIYPVLLELELGAPIYEKKIENVNYLLSKMEYIFPYAIYYLAIEDIDKGNGVGRESYLWLYERSNTQATADRRLEKFELMIHNFKKQASGDFPIKINEKGTLVADGAHRLMIARYFGVSDITCNIYRFDYEDYKKRMNWFLINQDDINASDLSVKAKERINQVAEIIRKD